MDKTMVSVPVEPTEAMLKAAHAAMLSDIPPDGESTYGPTISTHAIYRAYWAAMLSAAPAPQPVQGEAVAWRVRPHDTDISAARVINDARLAESMAAHRWLVAESHPQGVEAVRELVRRLYVELLCCDRQCASKGMTQGVSVRDVLADSLAYLDSTPKPTPAVQIPDHIADARKMVAAPGDTWPATEADEAAMAQADDAGNPAWWRGHDEACTILCQKVHAILDGRDSGRGVANEPWESTRRRLLAAALRSQGQADAVELHGVRDTLIVAANNPVSHGGLGGLRELMLTQAHRITAALAQQANKEQPANG